MMSIRKLLFLLLISVNWIIYSQQIFDGLPENPIDERINSISYWNRMIELGLIAPQEPIEPPSPIFTGRTEDNNHIIFEDETDKCIIEGSAFTQSENSVFINPNNEYQALVSNISTDWIGGESEIVFSADAFVTNDNGGSWIGQIEGAGGNNGGDPAVQIDLNNNYYVGHLSEYIV